MARGSKCSDPVDEAQLWFDTMQDFTDGVRSWDGQVIMD